MADGKPFKISQLPHIKNIDGDDLLLVSDKEGGKYYTKSMTVQQLVQTVISSILKSPTIMDQLKREAAAAAEEVAGNITAERVETIIQQNSNTTLDALDGKIDGQLVIGDEE